MWSLGADSVAVRVNPRVMDGFFEVGRDDLDWLAWDLVPSFRAIEGVLAADDGTHGADFR
jgi:hypothetical protein